MTNCSPFSLILEFVCLAGLLSDYNFRFHVASDIGIDSYYLPPQNILMQEHLNKISSWTDENLMVLNENKSKYIIFNRAQADFNTRLSINNRILEEVHEARVLGVVLTDDVKFEKNTQDICRRAFARITMLTKLKYVGVPNSDLVDVFSLFIRSLLEYCSVTWHSSLTKEQSDDIERVQRTALKVILGAEYTDYETSLTKCSLETLHSRREKRCLTFGLRSIKHPKLKSMFPLNNPLQAGFVRDRNKFKVNFARTSTYKKSAVPYIQNMLNDYFKNKKLPQ